MIRTSFKYITKVTLAAGILLSLTTTSCFKKVDVAQLAPTKGLIQTSPLTGSKNTILNISGTGFPDKAGIQVTVNGKPATVVSGTSNVIQAQVAPGTGTGKIQVIFDGTTYDAGTFTYLYTYTVSSYTNGSTIGGYQDGPVATAAFEDIEGIAIDASDNLYNSQYGAPRVRKINLNTNTVSTLVSGGVGNEEFVSTDAAGNVYVADETGRAIRKITPAGVVTKLISLPYTPHGVKVGKSGTIYVSANGSGNISAYDANGVQLWRLRSKGTGNVDGDTSLVQFTLIGGIEVDPSETKLYVSAVNGGYPNQVKVLDLTAKTITTVAGVKGSGFADGDAASAQFSYIYATRLDNRGGLYVVDLSNNRIRYIFNGKVTTVIGASAGDADGLGTAALLNNPQDIAFDSKGVMYISDYANGKIKKVFID